MFDIYNIYKDKEKLTNDSMNKDMKALIYIDYDKRYRIF